MDAGWFVRLVDLVDRWSIEPAAPGAAAFLHRAVVRAICDEQFFPDGLALEARALLLDLSTDDGEYLPAQMGSQLTDAENPGATGAVPHLEPIPNLNALHSYFHPLLIQTRIAEEIASDPALFFDWLKSTNADIWPNKVRQVADHLAVKAESLVDWCRRQGWAPPGFVISQLAVCVPATAGPSALEPAAMDRFEEPYWNLIQVFAWIFLGDRDFVTRASNNNDEVGLVSKLIEFPDGRQDFADTQSPGPTIATVMELGENRLTRYPGYAAAADALSRTLASGVLVAEGLANNQGDFQRVPAAFWSDARFRHDPDCATPVDADRPGATHWYRLRFASETVREIWPPFPAPDPGPTRSATSMLSFRQIAGRWLAEQPDTGLAADDVAVDLVALAEEGAFSTKVGQGEPHGPNYDPRSNTHLHVYDQAGRPLETAYLASYRDHGGHQGIRKRREVMARDLSLNLPVLWGWMATERGRNWRGIRGLSIPAFAAPHGPDATEMTIAGKKPCFEWLLGLMKAGDPDKPKKEFEQIARTKFRISGPVFLKAWAEAVEASGNFKWSKAGRRPKRTRPLG